MVSLTIKDDQRQLENSNGKTATPESVSNEGVSSAKSSSGKDARSDSEPSPNEPSVMSLSSREASSQKNNDLESIGDRPRAPKLNPSVLPTGLLNANFNAALSSANQVDLQLLKSMAASLGNGTSQNMLPPTVNSAFLNNSLRAGTQDALSPDLLAQASNLLPKLNMNKSLAAANGQSILNKELKLKGSLDPNCSSLISNKAEGKALDSASKLGLLPSEPAALLQALNASAVANAEQSIAKVADLNGSETNVKDNLSGSDNSQAITASLAGLLDNAGNVGNGLNLSQPYMQTLQAMMQQQQQQQQPQQQQQTKTSGDLSTSNSLASADVKVPPPGSDNKLDLPSTQTSYNSNETYRDFSRVGDDSSEFTTSQPPGKEPPFPVKLHRILANPEYADVISWLPHGRSWRVLKPKAFEEKVIPLYFRHAKYASFMRQVNGWGFKRMTQGPDHNSYYHELFLRGMQHLCFKMRRPTRARIDADPDFNPDFYRLSMVAPLPNQEVNNLVGMDNAANVNSMPSLQSGMNLANSGLSSIAGMNNMAGLVGMNNLAGMSAADNSFSANLLQQQIQQNQSSTIGQQLPMLSQGLQNAGTNLAVLGNGNSELGQLEALRQRREELIRQLQRMVNNGNTNTLTTPNADSLSNNAINSAPATNANGLLNTNNGMNINMNMNMNMSALQNGFGNTSSVGSLFNAGLGSGATSQLQQMSSLGINSSNQNPMLSNVGSLGANAFTGGLNMNNISNNLTQSLGGTGIGNINQHLLMQNGVGVGNGMNSNFGLGGMNMMTQNLGAMLQANQLGQQGNNNNGATSDGNPFGSKNPGGPQI